MSTAVSRRNLLETGGGAFAAAPLMLGAQGAHAAPSEGSKNEMVSRKYYKLWAGGPDWPAMDAILTDDFTFTAASGEDHISKAEFKHECYDNQIGQTKDFDIVAIMSSGDQVFIKYVGHTVGGHIFRNVELHRIRGGRIASVECYFGDLKGYPTAEDSKKS